MSVRVALVLRVVLSAAASLAVAPPAFAQSFRCSQATTAVEKMICADADLGDLDSDMSWAYLEARDRVDLASIGQVTWLGNVRNRCATVDCLRNAYVSRIVFLRKLGTAAQPATFPLDGLAAEWKRLGNTRGAFTTLTIDTVTADGFRFHMLGMSGNNYGEITGVAMRRAADALYESPDTDNCQLTFARQKTHLVVAAAPECALQVGMGVALDGEFQK